MQCPCSTVECTLLMMIFTYPAIIIMQYDVIVVGAGVEGSSTAYQLIKNGVRRVLLLEQVKFTALDVLVT